MLYPVLDWHSLPQDAITDGGIGETSVHFLTQPGVRAFP